MSLVQILGIVAAVIGAIALFGWILLIASVFLYAEDEDSQPIKRSKSD